MSRPRKLLPPAFEALLGRWRRKRQLQAVLSDYGKLKQMPHLLADIAIRGSVYAPHPAASDLWAAGIAEGRRQMALETIRLAQADHHTLSQIVFQPHEDA